MVIPSRICGLLAQIPLKGEDILSFLFNMYMVLPSRKSVQQILPLLIPRNSTFLPFNTFNWFFFFFFHGSSKCYLSQGRTKLIPQKWRGWFYGGKDQNTKKSLDHKFTCPPPPQKKIPYRTTRPKYATTTTNLQLYQAAQDNTCRIFLPKKSRNRKFQTQKILRSSPSLEIRSTSTGFLFNPKFLLRTFCLWRTS